MPVNKDEVVTDGVSQSVVLPDIIHTYVSEGNKDPNTRTYVGGTEGKEVLWHGDDEISYFTGTVHANYVAQ